MKTLILSLVLAVVTFLTSESFATQADDTTITITGQTAGPTPFISQLTLTASDTTVIGTFNSRSHPSRVPSLGLCPAPTPKIT